MAFANQRGLGSVHFFVGIDFGTSGARIIVLDQRNQVCFDQAIAFRTPRDQINPEIWRSTLLALLDSIPQSLKEKTRRIAIDGTSSTVLLCDHLGVPLTTPKLYNHSCDPETLVTLKHVAPPEHIVLSSTSSLAKLLDWQRDAVFSQARFLLHQADWLGAQLHGQWGVSDYHNSLKLGFDPQDLAYPSWFDQILQDPTLLPQVVKPGTVVEFIQPQLARTLGLPSQVQICTGTTDSIAAFLASGATTAGDAVTSLGSTIALKLLSQTRIEASSYGVYSHWFGQNWLVGGASNAGGAILAQYFSASELMTLSQKIDWSHAPLPDYIPLLRPGERFPINDPTLEPCLEPRSENPVEFLQALLVSLTRIEVAGYQKLNELGASPLRCVFSAGGGAKNQPWLEWRQRQLKVPMRQSHHAEAAYGTAKLASGCLEALT